MASSASAPGMDIVVGGGRRRSRMQPPECALHPCAALIEMRDRDLRDPLLDLLDGLFESLMAFAQDVGQCAFAYSALEQVGEQFAGALVRQELIVLEVHGRRLEAGTVLHRGVDPLGEGRLVQVAAGATLDLGLMLGDGQPNVWQIMDLSFLDALGWSMRQRAVATLAALNPVGLDTIGLLGHRERLPRMSGLTARGAPAFFPQALGRGFLEPIGGRRLAAVARVLGQLILEMADLRLQVLDALLQSVDARFPRKQHPHHGLLPGAVNGLSLFARQHAHNSRRKPWVRG